MYRQTFRYTCYQMPKLHSTQQEELVRINTMPFTCRISTWRNYSMHAIISNKQSQSCAMHVILYHRHLPAPHQLQLHNQQDVGNLQPNNLKKIKHQTININNPRGKEENAPKRRPRPCPPAARPHRRRQRGRHDGQLDLVTGPLRPGPRPQHQPPRPSRQAFYLFFSHCRPNNNDDEK